MSFLGKIFNKKSDASEPPELTPPPASPPPPGAPATMKVWDNYGRIVEISREEWRTRVLPHNFRANWNQPDDLAGLIHNALTDGFIADCLEPARQLHRIDPHLRRGANFLAVTLLHLKQYDEAEKVVTDCMRQRGEEGTLLTNLAKAQSGRGEEALAERTLWHALEVDPNQDNGLVWYVAIHRERGGETAELDALRRIAALPGSWRAQVWIGRHALKAKQLEQALQLYRESLSRAGKPVPTDLLYQVSGDLGMNGHIPEILELIAPHFDPARHGLMVGNNLIKANVDLGQLDAARRILDQLYQQNRGDWKEHLSFWDTEIAKAKVALHEAPREQPSIAMLTIVGPVWLKPESPAAELFPAKRTEAPTIALLGSVAEIMSNSKRMQHQMSDSPGRMSRALPLFLAEQLEFGSNARVQTLVPWVMGDAPGFMFGGAPWDDADAAAYARQTEAKNDYVVVLFLKPNTEPWIAELRLVRTIDAKCLGTVAGNILPAQTEVGIPALANQLLALLRAEVEVQIVSPPPQYQLPVGAWFGSYLLRLEQLLAVRCSGMDGVPSRFLNGEREIIDGNLQLCLEHPQNVGVRILFIQTLLAMKHARPTVLPEYREKLTRLQNEKPLPEPAHSVLQRMLSETWMP
ncbi:MAG TPA: tetratricopeptide repeat protein [Verrucomicrobiae bacterium]|nr:tetratricopeptide repeat protein [Verrucomicrobiae bacterium]